MFTEGKILYLSMLLYEEFILFTTHKLLGSLKDFFSRQLEKKWQNEEEGRDAVIFCLKWVLSGCIKLC